MQQLAKTFHNNNNNEPLVMTIIHKTNGDNDVNDDNDDNRHKYGHRDIPTQNNHGKFANFT